MTDARLTPSSHHFILSPILDDQTQFEIIEPHTVSRAPIYIVKSKDVVLGRNDLTKIHDPKISRCLATVSACYVDDDASNHRPITVPKVKVHLNQCGAIHRFCINGIKLLEEECYIQNGDIIGLYGDRYQYRLDIFDLRDTPVSSQSIDALKQVKQECIDDFAFHPTEETYDEDSKQTVKRKRIDTFDSNTDSQRNSQDYLTDDNGICTSSSQAKNSTDSKHQAIITSACQHIVDTVTCTVCMEILVKAHAVNPCGHIFCKACVQQILPQQSGQGFVSKPCPNCRKSMKSITHLKSMDNLIWNMILRGDLFEEEDDLKEFMKRSGKKWSDLKKEEIECIFGRKNVDMERLIQSDVEVVHEQSIDSPTKKNAKISLSMMGTGGNLYSRHVTLLRHVFHRSSPRPSNRSNNRGRVQYQGTGSRDDPIVL